MRRTRIFGLISVAVCLVTFVATISAAVKSPASNRSGDIALIGAKVYPSPSDAPFEHGTVLIRNGKIVAVGAQESVKIPRNAARINCEGLALVAGFWNSHVHFTESKWTDASSMPSSQLTRQLQEMLTRYGYTTVFDTGSHWAITKTIRQRITSGDCDGPRIYSVGEILFPKGASSGDMVEVENAAQGVEATRRQLDKGVDAIKIYAQAFWNLDLKMPLDAMKAITATAHRRGKLVLVHPSNSYGLEAAIESGADVLVHTTPQTGEWGEGILARMKQGKMALIPTLKLWRFELEKDGAPADAIQRFQDKGVKQLRAYYQAGGQILFGTDVGYMTDYDPTEEYQQMARAGMGFRDILASLTTSPAERFGHSRKAGRIAPGMDADIVVLAADPAKDIGALSRVRYTLRQGRIIFQAGPSNPE